MAILKQRLLGIIVGGIVGVATVSGVGVALASNGERSGGTPGITTPVSVSTSDVRGMDERGEREPGDDQSEQGDNSGSGSSEGQQGDNSGSGSSEGQQGDNSGSGSSEGQQGDSSGSGSD